MIDTCIYFTATCIYIFFISIIDFDYSADFSLNEKYLYHGTRANRLRLCEEGLDHRLSYQGCFGRGIYFRYDTFLVILIDSLSNQRDVFFQIYNQIKIIYCSYFL